MDFMLVGFFVSIVLPVAAAPRRSGRPGSNEMYAAMKLVEADAVSVRGRLMEERYAGRRGTEGEAKSRRCGGANWGFSTPPPP